MRVELAKLHDELKATMIYVTHDQVEAMTMADRIVVLNAGLIEQVGTPLELYHRPRNLFVAGFIGSPTMNFIEVKATATSDQGRHRPAAGRRGADHSGRERRRVGRRRAHARRAPGTSEGRRRPAPSLVR